MDELLQELSTGFDRVPIDPALVAQWVEQWSAPSEMFELTDGTGRPYTAAEKVAATTSTSLGPADPAPQVVHLIAAKPGAPLLLRVTVRVHRAPKA